MREDKNELFVRNAAWLLLKSARRLFSLAPPGRMNFAHLEKWVASVVVQLLFARGEKLLLLEKQINLFAQLFIIKAVLNFY